MCVDLDAPLRDLVVQVEGATRRVEDIGANEGDVAPCVARVLVVNVVDWTGSRSHRVVSAQRSGHGTAGDEP